MGLGTARRVACRLPPSPDSVGAARRAVRATLHDWRLDGVADTATLLVSELATNVLLHARTEFEVRIARRNGAVHVVVLDASDRRPARRRYGLDAGTGRGLGLVETLSSSWGVDVGDGPWAKAVWFQLAENGSSAEPREGALYGEDWLALVDGL